MRNIFDQYTQPENKLTHALVVTLSRVPSLLRPFLEWIGLRDVPPIKTLSICEQQVPGAPLTDLDEGDAAGLPDACIYSDEGWAVFFECKVQSQISLKQIHRHHGTAKRYGFQSAHLVVISVDLPQSSVSKLAHAITWRDLYCWFSKRSGESKWVQDFVQYMQIFETKMLAQEYDIRGTITVFDGLRFDAKNPYTYREGKRLIRLLGDELQKRKDLHGIGVDPKGQRRTAITGRDRDFVWDLLPLTLARDAKEFTAFPHLSMGLHSSHATAAITVPNGVKGGFRSRLAARGEDGFRQLLGKIEKRIRPIAKKTPGSKPMIYVLQRHYRSQSSAGIVDARLEADLRTALPGASDGVLHQPEWLDAIFGVLVNKKSNIQFGIDLTMPYTSAIVRSEQAVDLFAEAWIAMSPLLELVFDD